MVGYLYALVGVIYLFGVAHCVVLRGLFYLGCVLRFSLGFRGGGYVFISSVAL